MSDDPRRLTTQEQRERLSIARNRGGICAACGRALDAGEPVYWENFTISGTGGLTAHRRGAVDAECASPWILEEMAGEAPDPCVGCGRPVYDSAPRANLRRAACSQRCGDRARAARRSASKGES